MSIPAIPGFFERGRITACLNEEGTKQVTMQLFIMEKLVGPTELITLNRVLELLMFLEIIPDQLNLAFLTAC